jgi:hypothetical protein
MKKVSLKKLKELRDFLNCYMPSYMLVKAYITAFAHDIETKQQIHITKTYKEYAERKDANWTYKLVLGEPITELTK